jgi:hypothetical protein
MIKSMKKESFYSKALPARIDYEQLSPYFHSFDEKLEAQEDKPFDYFLQSTA